MVRNLRNSGQPMEIGAEGGSPRGLKSAVVLDPSPLWAQLVERVLARIGITVVASPADARGALAAVAEHDPDLLVAEIDGDGSPAIGIGLVRRACEAASELKVIVLSGVSEEAVIEGALAAGAAAYIVKTERPTQLKLAFRQAVHHSLAHPGKAPVPTPTPIAS